MIDYIIPVWITDQETLDLTQSAIGSFKLATPDARIIVIDNNSPLGGGYLRQIANIYIRNNQNLGFVPAVNQGLRLTKADTISIANNDILVSPNWYNIAEPILKDQTVGVVHFRMLNYDEPSFIYGNGIAYTGKERWCTNSFFVTTRFFLKKLAKLEEGKELDPGLFDENFGKGIYDDYDWRYRIYKAGFKQVYTDKACYRHKMTYTFNKLPSAEREEEIKNNLNYFIKKWGKDPEVLFAETWPEQWQENYSTGFKLKGGEI